MNADRSASWTPIKWEDTLAHATDLPPMTESEAAGLARLLDEFAERRARIVEGGMSGNGDVDTANDE